MLLDRYSRPNMVKIWQDNYKFEIQLKIEKIVSQIQAKLKIIPQEAADIINSKGSFSLSRIKELELILKHETLAFLTNISENINDPLSRFLHYGLTSSDLLDTSFNLQLKQSSDLLIIDIDNLLKTLKQKAIEHKYTICMGRSHGIHAEPITFGLKMAYAYAEFKRHKSRLINAQKQISICMISGPMGTYSGLGGIEIQNQVAKELNLESEDISTQIIPRDRYAEYFSILAIIASSIERLATEIRHLQCTEINEVSELFDNTQKGSSSMPHKKNPILSENLVGLSRVIRSIVIPVIENIILWHERDMSHSSVERIIGPEANILLDFALHRLSNIINNLYINVEQMKHNTLSDNYSFLSHKIMLSMIQSGISREDAYKKIQSNSQQKNNLLSYINDEDKKDIFSYYTQYVNNIFHKVFDCI